MLGKHALEAGDRADYARVKADGTNSTRRRLSKTNSVPTSADLQSHDLFSSDSLDIKPQNNIDGDSDGDCDGDEYVYDEEEDMELISALPVSLTNSTASPEDTATIGVNPIITSDEDGEEEDDNEDIAAVSASNNTTMTPKQLRKRRNAYPQKCTFPGCDFMIPQIQRRCHHMRSHQTEFQTEVSGMTLKFKRKNLDEPWPCPFAECSHEPFTILSSLLRHTKTDHIDRSRKSVKGIMAGTDVSQQLRQQQQQQQEKEENTLESQTTADGGSSATARGEIQLFNIGGVECGFHLATCAFVCFECKLVPESLTSHLNTRHKLDNITINTRDLPPDIIPSEYDPDSNQHTSNSNLALTIDSETGELISSAHSDVLAGVKCTHGDCTYSTRHMRSMRYHWFSRHPSSSQQYTSAALLRYPVSASAYSYLFIRYLDCNMASGSARAADTPSNSASPEDTRITRRQSARLSGVGKPPSLHAIEPSQPSIDSQVFASPARGSDMLVSDTTVSSHVAMPPLFPTVGDPLLFTHFNGARLHFTDIYSGVNKLLTDATALLDQLTYGFIRSSSLQLSDQTPSDLDQSEFGFHLTAICDGELRRYYKHLKQRAPELHSIVKTGALTSNSISYATLISGHDHLLQIIAMLIVLTGGALPISDSELSSLRISSDSDINAGSNVYLHSGYCVLVYSQAKLDGSASTAIRMYPRPVSQLLLDFLVLVRRPLINIEGRRNKSPLLTRLKSFLFPSWVDSDDSGSAASAFSNLSQQYFGSRLTLDAFRDISRIWSEHFGIPHIQAAPGNVLTTRQMASSFKACQRWHKLFSENDSQFIS